jgi:TRAP-type C4-dicarboxylate transport system substrate-binding protein
MRGARLWNTRRRAVRAQSGGVAQGRTLRQSKNNPPEETMSKTLRAAAAALAAALLATVAGAAELKFANFMPPTNPYEAGAFRPFAEKLAAATGGAVTVRLYSGGELGPGPVEQYARAVDGVADLAVGLPGYTASTFPLTLLAELPGVVDEAGGTAALWDNIDLFGKEFRRAELVSLWTNAQNVLFMRDRAVRAPADVAGLKIRVPSRNAGLVVESWGATPVSMPVLEIYNAMQTGVIDGAMIDGTATKAFKLGEVANHVVMGMDAPISLFFIVMNRDSFAELSEAQRASVKTVGREVSALANRTQLDAAAQGIEAFAALPGKTVTRLSEAEAASFDTLSAEVRERIVAEAEAAGVPARAAVAALSGN